MKTRLLLYCTKNKWRLFFDKVKQVFTLGKVKSNNDLNGKIVAECDFEVEEIDTMALSEHVYDDYYNNNIDRISKESCLTCEQMSEYLGSTWDSKGYAIHIKNLHIFDEPKELNEYLNNKYWNSHFGNDLVSKAPQNMMRVYKLKDIEWEEYILISIQPQWMCKILNGEKTIEIRKKVLKEMLKNE